MYVCLPSYSHMYTYTCTKFNVLVLSSFSLPLSLFLSHSPPSLSLPPSPSLSPPPSLSLPPDALVCTGCCSTLNHILTYLFKKLSKSKGPLSPSRQTPFLKILEIRPEILQQMLSSVMNIIMFESCRNQWSMSRPLLGLILLNEEV